MAQYSRQDQGRANHQQRLGRLGEQLVADWLQGQQWLLLQQRWQCRWGEIDLIAQHGCQIAGEPVLALIEVKTRGQSNWDANGLLAVSSRKQAKLWQTARSFLAQYPEFADFSCRFDVALVVGKQQDAAPPDDSPQLQPLIQLGQPVWRSGYQLTLQDYIPNAFL